jgi:hypothetical protein
VVFQQVEIKLIHLVQSKMNRTKLTWLTLRSAAVMQRAQRFLMKHYASYAGMTKAFWQFLAVV